MIHSGFSSDWLERLLGVEKVGRSNRPTQTKSEKSDEDENPEGNDEHRVRHQEQWACQEVDIGRLQESRCKSRRGFEEVEVKLPQ